MLGRLKPVLLIVVLSVTAVFAAPGIFWTDESTDTIHHANLDGTGAVVLVPPPQSENPGALALDSVAGKIYWATFEFIEFTPKIKRANLDGSSPEELVARDLLIPAGIGLDLKAGKMYWADQGTGKIQRANLDGFGVEDLISGLESPRALALEVAGRGNDEDEDEDGGGSSRPTPRARHATFGQSKTKTVVAPAPR